MDVLGFAGLATRNFGLLGVVMLSIAPRGSTSIEVRKMNHSSHYEGEGDLRRILTSCQVSQKTLCGAEPLLAIKMQGEELVAGCSERGATHTS